MRDQKTDAQWRSSKPSEYLFHENALALLMNYKERNYCQYAFFACPLALLNKQTA